MAEPAAHRRDRVLALLRKLPNEAAFKFAEAAGVFAPFAFMIDQPDDPASPRTGGGAGRIAASSLPRIWRWLSQTIAPDAALPVLETIAEAAIGVEVSEERRDAAIRKFRAEAGRKAVSAMQALSPEELEGAMGDARAAHDARLVAQLFVIAPDIERLNLMTEEDLDGQPSEIRGLASDIAERAPQCKTAFLCALIARSGHVVSVAPLMLALSKRKDEHRLDAAELSVALAAAIDATCFLRRADLAAPSVSPRDATSIAEARAREIDELARALRGHVTEDWRHRLNARTGAASMDFERVCDRFARLVEDALATPKRALREHGVNMIADCAAFLAGSERVAIALRFDIARRRAVSAVRDHFDSRRAAAIDERLADLARHSSTEAEHFVELLVRIVEQLEGRSAARAWARRGRRVIGRPSFEEHVFSVLDPIIVEADPSALRRGQVSRDLVDEAWAWIADRPGMLARDEAIAEFEQLRDIDAEAAGAVVADYRSKMVEVLRAARDADAGFLQTGAGGSSDAQLMTLIAVLDADAEIRALLDEWPAHIKNVSEEHIAAARDLHDTVVRRWPDVGPSLLLILMSRLERPWHVLRMLERVARTRSDTLVEATEYVAIGEVLIDIAAAAAAAFAPPRHEPFHCERVLAPLERFAGIASGMTEEFSIRQNGVWGRRYYAIKAKAARDLEELCARAVRAVEAVTPRRALGAGRWTADVRAPLEDRDVADATEFARFLRGTKVLDQRAAFAGPRSGAMSQVQGRLETQIQALLDLAHAGQEPRDCALEHLDALVRVVGEFEGEEAGEIVRRRAAAA